MKNKISIGTAQFGMGYGVTNNKKFISNREIGKILSYAKKNKISKIDTAYSYESVEKRLGKFNLKKWKISTKIPTTPNQINLDYWIKKKINISLKRLNIKKFDTIFIHDMNELKNLKKFEKIYFSLLRLKKQKITKYIGCSIYEPNDLKKILKFKFDVIQAPANIFNDEIFKKKNVSFLKNRGAKLEIRSIFLQGLLLVNPSKLPRIFKKWKEIFLKLDYFHKKKKISKISMAFSILRGKKYRSVIVGISSFNDFKEIIRNMSKKSIKPPNFKIFNKEKLINPKKWKL
tara:strand:- start:562 stop:1425 length:864 start_codon:yes stop_codon:yes gene_type:complete